MGETTLLIQKRIRHWRTTIAGIVCWLAPVALLIWPDQAAQITAIAFAVTGTGLIAAPDSKNTDKPPLT